MPSDDLIDVVDENDIVIDVIPKGVINKEVLTHRGVVIALLNSKDEIFMHKRSSDKLLYPGLWAIFFGGIVDHGEDYETAALRELEEESGIKAEKLNFLAGFRHKTETNDWFGKLYRYVSDDEVIIQEEEIEEGFFIPIGRLEEFIDTHDMSPSDRFVYDSFRDLILSS